MKNNQDQPSEKYSNSRNSKIVPDLTKNENLVKDDKGQWGFKDDKIKRKFMMLYTI